MSGKKTILYYLMVCIMSACYSPKEKDEQTKRSDIQKKETCGDFVSQLPTLNVYNMGGVPEKDVNSLVEKLKTVYPYVRYAGDLSLVESAYIKNDPKGKNRYRWSVLRPYLIKTTDTKNGITLVIVNAEICTMEKSGSHANLGMSNVGGHVSTISYQRLKVNNLNNLNDMTKVIIHELGHSVARLVIDRPDLKHHCPNKECLMKGANNKFPYRGIVSFCPSCSKALEAKGFKLDCLNLKPS